MNLTLFDKIWKAHVVKSIENGPDVLFIDRHFIHEVTTPQAFAGLEKRGISVLMPERTVATADHNVPTKNQHLPIPEKLSRLQVEKLMENCKNHGIDLFGLGHPNQGIVHVIGPELGITLPGITLVCGDSHTSTHGALGALAFGIGTSEVEQVLATQCLLQQKPKNMRITVNGTLNKGVTSKDLILYVISKITTGGGTGHFAEYSGTAIKNLSIEARMTVCNMSIELGAKGGIIAPDETTFEYISRTPFGKDKARFEKAVEQWKKLPSDADAKFDVEYTFDAGDIEPMITFGTNPGMGMAITGNIPDNENQQDLINALRYMNLEPGAPLLGKKINYVFIGSCTNSRIEDLRSVAQLVKGKNKAAHVNCWVVPGSRHVMKQAIEEGIAAVLEEAGFELREPGCSACLGMNEDKVPAGEYCVSTSNRNFEGRQGPGSRTLLASPLTAAACAITGHITDPRELI